ncbi:MAG: hypothetical protein LBN22_11595 [Clostridiales Family XIII bacterium]|jgi:hypothetical protein|nr:hypothetical protein [Clostridiales Family XIII bacterium]
MTGLLIALVCISSLNLIVQLAMYSQIEIMRKSINDAVGATKSLRIINGAK